MWKQIIAIRFRRVLSVGNTSCMEERIVKAFIVFLRFAHKTPNPKQHSIIILVRWEFVIHIILFPSKVGCFLSCKNIQWNKFIFREPKTIKYSYFGTLHNLMTMRSYSGWYNIWNLLIQHDVYLKLFMCIFLILHVLY